MNEQGQLAFLTRPILAVGRTLLHHWLVTVGFGSVIAYGSLVAGAAQGWYEDHGTGTAIGLSAGIPVLGAIALYFGNILRKRYQNRCLEIANAMQHETLLLSASNDGTAAAKSAEANTNTALKALSDNLVRSIMTQIGTSDKRVCFIYQDENGFPAAWPLLGHRPEQKTIERVNTALRNRPGCHGRCMEVGRVLTVPDTSRPADELETKYGYVATGEPPYHSGMSIARVETFDPNERRMIHLGTLSVSWTKKTRPPDTFEERIIQNFANKIGTILGVAHYVHEQEVDLQRFLTLAQQHSMRAASEGVRQ